MKKPVLLTTGLFLLAFTSWGQDVLKSGTSRFLHTSGTQNLFLGVNTGTANTSGTHNAFYGLGSGLVNSTGGFNAFFGANTGYYNTTGANNTFIGSLAGESNTTGGINTFVGQGAGYKNTTGRENTFVGTASGVANISGESNVFLGVSSGSANTGGSYNVFIGRVAGAANTTGSNNSIAGFNAGSRSTTGINNAFYGWASGYENTTGSDNAAFGAQAGGLATTGRYNTYVGKLAGYNNVTGNSNTLIGSGADVFGTGKANLTNATAIGANARVSISNALILGDSVGVSVGIGTTRPANRLEVRSFSSNTSGLRFTNLTSNSPTVTGTGKVLSVNSLGDIVLVPGSTGGGSASTHSDSVWVRNSANTYYSGNGNVGIGTNIPAYKLDVNGDINLAPYKNIRIAGDIYIRGNPGPNASVSIGGFAGSDGLQNVFIGTYAGTFNSISGNPANGTANTFVGYRSGGNNTTGSINTYIGSNSGSSNNTGSNNLFLGSFSNSVGSNASSLQNVVALGTNAKVAISNAIILGDTANTNIKVGIGTAAPRYTLDVKGSVNIRGGRGGPGQLLFGARTFLHRDDQDYLVLAGGSSGESGLRFANLSNQFSPTKESQSVLSVDEQGRIGLYRVGVDASQVRVKVASTNQWADHVFSTSYKLGSIADMQAYVKANNHLPHIPSAEQMVVEGRNAQELIANVVKTQEEQALYIIQLKEENDRLSVESKQLRQDIAALKLLVEQLLKK